jgi:hypothetical protein
MRRDYLGFVLLIYGAGVLFGAMETTAANRALGNPIEGDFLLELLAWGLVGAAVLVAGIVLVVQSVRHPVARQPLRPLTNPAPEPTGAYRTPWSAIAFLIFIVLLVLLYLGLVLIASGIQGVLLQFVFWVPIIVVLLILARWWSMMTSPRSEPPPSPK